MSGERWRRQRVRILLLKSSDQDFLCMVSPVIMVVHNIDSSNNIMLAGVVIWYATLEV